MLNFMISHYSMYTMIICVQNVCELGGSNSVGGGFTHRLQCYQQVLLDSVFTEQLKKMFHTLLLFCSCCLTGKFILFSFLKNKAPSAIFLRLLQIHRYDFSEPVTISQI